MQRVSSYCQFAYTTVQEHAVWRNADFWELLFYQDAQRDLHRVYLNERPSASPTVPAATASGASLRASESVSMLELMAEQLEAAASASGEGESDFAKVRARLAGIEEELLISRANHLVTLVINFRVPLDVDKFIYSSDEHTRFKDRNAAEVASHARHAQALMPHLHVQTFTSSFTSSPTPTLTCRQYTARYAVQ